MPNNDTFDFNNTNLTREAMESEMTLGELKKKEEQEMKALRFENTKSYYKLNEDLEKNANTLNNKNLQDFNSRREELEKKYAQQVTDNANDELELRKKIADELNEYTLQLNRQQSTDNLKNIRDEYQERIKIHQEFLDEVKKKQIEATDEQIEESKRAIEETNKLLASSYGLDENNPLRGMLTGQGASVREYLEAVNSTGTASVGETAMLSAIEGMEDSFNSMMNGWENLFQSTIDNYSQYQTISMTRLQGSGYTWGGYNGLESTMSSAIGTNAYVRLDAVMEDLMDAINSGVAYNLELRAFLQTVSDEVAATFDAFDSNLLRLIRLQQSDSTAARLGFEANLTQLFNELYSDTAYLSDEFDSVSSSLIEAMSTMGTEMGVEFEYEVQKWLGSLYSAGMSSSGVTSIAEALGGLGSGDVGILSTGAGQLLVMSASRAGLDIGNLLTNGLTAETTNVLLESMVEYLQEIAASSADSLVQQNQWADLFGMSISDITAATNLAASMSDISNTSLSYAGAIDELYSQMGQLNERVSVGGQLSNLLGNVQYSIGAGIANNPVTYALWEITSMIEDLTGGINLPTVSVLGNSVDLNTTVTNLMRSGIVGVSTLGAIGDIISGVGGTFNGGSILDRLGLTSGVSVNTRGTIGSGTSRVSGATSSSAIIGNSSGEDYYQQALVSANEQTSSILIQAQEESEAKTLDDIYDYLVDYLDPTLLSINANLSTLVSQNGLIVGDIGVNGFAVNVSAIESEGYLSLAENIKTITSSVDGIYSLLTSVISNGTLKVSFDNTSSWFQSLKGFQ